MCVANHVHVDIVKRRITCLDGLLLPTCTWKLTPSWPPGFAGSLKSAWDAWHGRTRGGTGLHDPTPGRRQSSPNIDNWTIPCTILAANAFGPIQTRTYLVWVRWDTSWLWGFSDPCCGYWSPHHAIAMMTIDTCYITSLSFRDVSFLENVSLHHAGLG